MKYIDLAMEVYSHFGLIDKIELVNLTEDYEITHCGKQGLCVNYSKLNVPISDVPIEFAGYRVKIEFTKGYTMCDEERRWELIYKDIFGMLTNEEKSELALLQSKVGICSPYRRSKLIENEEYVED